MAREVMAQLPGSDEEHEEEFLLHRVTLLRIPQHRADEIYWVLHEARHRSVFILFTGGVVGLHLDDL
jgi:hypothetical protein